jgi:uncharacterized protein (TIGR02217 family)
MAFIESPSLPAEIALGASGGAMFQTAVTDSTSGYEARAQQWTTERGAYELGYVNRTAAQMEALIAFFYAVAIGRWQGFRFLDYGAGEAIGLDEYLGDGDGTDTTFQLRKAYVQESEVSYRTITKPVAGTVRCTLDGVATTAFTVDTTTGIVTFSVAPGNGVVVRASFQFEVPVRADVDWLQIRSVQRGVYSIENFPLLEIRDIA